MGWDGSSLWWQAGFLPAASSSEKQSRQRLLQLAAGLAVHPRLNRPPFVPAQDRQVPLLIFSQTGLLNSILPSPISASRQPEHNQSQQISKLQPHKRYFHCQQYPLRANKSLTSLCTRMLSIPQQPLILLHYRYCPFQIIIQACECALLETPQQIVQLQVSVLNIPT